MYIALPISRKILNDKTSSFHIQFLVYINDPFTDSLRDSFYSKLQNKTGTLLYQIIIKNCVLNIR